MKARTEIFLDGFECLRLDGNPLDRIRPDNDARISRACGDILRHPTMVEADGIELSIQS
jgi:hypothetical protein